ncbi:MAG TPA: hypothetical protein VMD05_05255 [Candidatus Nanoarchaeia archaeon]|nr:hypothetical protein [Candidatus Nanoarchaeia archaeon]
MNLLKDRRGVARIIEAFLASILIISCLYLVPISTISKDSTVSLASKAQNALLSLDNNGHLATLIDEQNWTALKDCVASTLPLTSWFNLTVFDKDMNCINPFPISNAGLVSDKIVSVNYVCASQSSTYKIYTLRLQLSGVGL